MWYPNPYYTDEEIIEILILPHLVCKLFKAKDCILFISVSQVPYTTHLNTQSGDKETKREIQQKKKKTDREKQSFTILYVYPFVEYLISSTNL